MRLEWINIGKIVNVHGIQGDLKLQPRGVTPSLLLGSRTFRIGGKEVHPASLRLHKDMLLFRLPGVEDRDSAMTYRDQTVFLCRGDAALPEGTVFDEELLGMTVQDSADGSEIGVITDVLTYPAHQVYEVKGQREYLIPAVPGVFIQSIDAEAGVVQVRMMEGLETDAN